MPSDNKRVNLTFPDEIYQMLRKYMESNGLFQAATACRQLILKQLKKEGYNA